MNTRRSAHSSKYRYLLSPPQRPLCHGEAGEKEKESARGTNRPRVFYSFVYCYCYRATQEPPRRKQRLPLQAQVQCRIQTLRQADKTLRGRGGGRSYIRLHSGKTSLTRENKADCSESSGCGDFN